MDISVVMFWTFSLEKKFKKTFATVQALTASSGLQASLAGATPKTNLCHQL